MSAPITQPAPAQQQTSPAQRLEQVRSRIRSVSHNITISEGRLLDFASAGEIQRALSAALREIQALTITISVMPRREVRS